MRNLSFLPLLALTALLASCAAPPPPPAPAPPPAAPPAPSPPPSDWRDLPITAGEWRYRSGPDGSKADFGVSTGSPVFTIRCPAGGRRIVFTRPGQLDPVASAMMRFTASAGTWAIPVRAAPDALPLITGDASAFDPFLDKIVFSRGRFVVETSGQPRLVLPAWPEVARVIEDCRA